MKNILWIRHSDGLITIALRTLDDAEIFLRGQQPQNPSWLEIWEIKFVHAWGDTYVTVSTDKMVVLRFDV